MLANWPNAVFMPDVNYIAENLKFLKAKTRLGTSRTHLVNRAQGAPHSSARHVL